MVRVHLLASLVGAVAVAVGSASTLKGHDGEYVAAFVELAAQAVGTNGPATLALNAKLSGEAAARAASQGAQIVVLPEYGMSGFGGGRDSWVPYLEQLPVPVPTGAQGGADVPCDARARYTAAPSLIALSCAARAHGIAIVANLGDLIYCSPRPLHPGCMTSHDGRLQFNTAVAFDTDGSYIAKAHKQNLWGEASYFDTPQDCPDVTFTTSFGVEFGLFTCADLIFRDPAELMVGRGVKNYVVPIAWSNEMAQMQAIPCLQGWSLDRCVNLVAANHRTTTMSGSGAFSCGRVEAAVYSPGRKSGTVHVVTLPKVPSRAHAVNATAGAVQVAAHHHHHHHLRIPVGGKPGAAAPPLPLPLQGSGGVLNASGPLPLARPRSAVGWAFAPLASGRVCSGTVCCTASGVVGSGSGYAIAALQGDDDGGGITWYGEACTVLPCATPGPRCLDYQTPPAPGLTKVALKMVIGPGASKRGEVTAGAAFSNPVAHQGLGLLPMVLAVSSDGTQQHLLQPGPALGYDASSLELTASTAGAAPRSTLASVVVYGRVYDRDTLAYSCPGVRPCEGRDLDACSTELGSWCCNLEAYHCACSQYGTADQIGRICSSQPKGGINCNKCKAAPQCLVASTQPVVPVAVA